MSGEGNARYFMDRAINAEDRVEELEHEVRLLRANVKGALNMDATTAVAALGWVTRAERAEELLTEAVRYVRQRSLHTEDFPPGWVTRAEAQVKSVEILRRDQAELAERPSSGDYWATEDGPDGRRRIIRRR